MARWPNQSDTDRWLTIAIENLDRSSHELSRNNALYAQFWSSHSTRKMPLTQRIVAAAKCHREDLIPFAVASALFMHLMDTAALATALPTIAKAFGRDTVDLRVLLTVYMATIAVLVPASAWLSARIGIKRLFVIAMVFFVLGSSACALAQSIPQLIAARILQGIGGAMMTPVGRTMLVRLVPRAGLVRAMTLFTLPGIIAPLVGPPLAGLIVEEASWRWVFLINVPVCLFGVIAVIFLVPKIADDPKERFDLVGFGLIFIGMALLSALIDKSIPIGSGLIVNGALIAGIFCTWVAYRFHAKRCAAPLLDPVLLRAPTLMISLWSGLFQRMAVGALPFLLPLLLQDALQMSPLEAGQIMVASAAGGLTARFVVSPLLRFMSLRSLMILSAASASLVTATFGLLGFGTPIWMIIAMLGLIGVIRSGFFIPATAIAYVDVEPRAEGQATVLFTIVQQFSLSLGISISAMLLDYGRSATGPIAPGDFAFPFVGIAIISSVSLVWLWQLPKNAGDALREG